MNAIIVCGARGHGKTTLVKKIIAPTDKGRLLVNDINREYYNPPRKPMPIDDFLGVACSMEDTVIVFEESTIFFSTRGRNEAVIQLLVESRHTNNFLIFVFHSIRSIPNYIVELVDKIYLFHTNDKPEIVKQKYSLLFDDYLKVHNKKFVCRVVRPA